MNCLHCRQHSLMLVSVEGFCKTELTCWEVKGGKTVEVKPNEENVYVIATPDWCPLTAKEKP